MKLQSSKLLTSYTISPQAVFTCPPCSIRSRRRGDEPAQRFTYCSITSPKPRLLCFSEFSNAEITTTSINLSKEAAPVIHLDAFEAASGNKILALHEDGTVKCYSNGLETEEWHSNINASVSNLVSVPAIIQAAAMLSVQQARRTILRSREDILATLGPDEDATDRRLLLVMTRSPTKDANRSAGTLELRIFCIEVAAPDKMGPALGTVQKLQPLTTLAMPEPSLYISKNSQITIHTASGTVYQEVEGALAVYDLTGSVPRLVHTVLRNDAFSYLRLSPELVAASRGASLSVMELQYGSLQTEGTLTLSHEGKLTEKSEAIVKPTTTENVRLLSYFAPLDVMVALDGRKLLAVQSLTSQKLDGSRKRKRGGLLVNSLGRGSSSVTGASPSSRGSAHKIRSLGTYLSSSDSIGWKSQKATLDRCIAQNDEKEFERLMAAALGMKAAEEDKQISNSGGQNHVDQHTVSYVLNAMFSVDQASLDVHSAGDDPRSLDICFFPHKIGTWLIDKGLLTLSQIEMSLKQYGALPLTSKLATGSLIRALARFDSSLEILLVILASPVPLSSQELVHVLVIVAESPHAKTTDTQRLLTNGDGADDNSNDDKSQLANRQTTLFLPSPSSTITDNNINRRVLSFTMKRLHACPSSSVARALKRELSTPQLRILVDTLRMEIARSGWLSPYEESQETLDLDLQDDSQMCLIAHLLNCVIDSLGTGGWILCNSVSDDLTETADTIAYMKAEISAVLEGIEEATYLKGMLGEILLCGKDSLGSSVKQSRSNETQLPALPAKPITIALDEEDSQLLPLGLKVAPVISATKVGAGGELIKRSRRDIGRLKSKMVGKYSFDRIMI